MEPTKMHVEESDPDASQILFIGALGAILVVVAIFFLQGLYERRTRFEFKGKTVTEPPPDLREARAAQLEKFQPRWIDKDAGIVALPIERAMELVAASADPAAPVGGK